MIKTPTNHLSLPRLKLSLLAILCWSLVALPLVVLTSTLAPAVIAQEGGIADDEVGTTNPKDRANHVTATVVEFGTLEAPTLVSPGNNSSSRDNTPTFIWEDPADNSLATEYLFYLNDSLVYTLPLVSQTTLDYELYYDGASRYSLTLINSLTDGTYTWKIVAEDVFSNTISSTTWSFIIDTRPPDFEITRIEDIATNLAAGNQHNIPTEPFEITENDPEFKGVSDAGDYVEVTITLADGTTRTDTFTVGDDGNWNRFFSSLPRDELIELDFVITDVLGNSIRLDDVLLFITTPTITITIPSILTPPSVIPEPPIALITFHVTPPDEIIKKVIKQLPPFIVQPATYLNATLRVKTVDYWLNFQRALIEWLALLVIITLTATQISALALIWRKYLSKDLISSMLMIVGLIPDGQPQGIAAEYPTQDPIPYGLITFSGQENSHQHYNAHRITNKHGIFFDVSLPQGKYRAAVKHPAFFFPVMEPPPTHLDKYRFYTGGEISINKKPLPMLAIFASSRNVQLKSMAVVQRIVGIAKLSWPVWLVLLLITVVLPTFGNISVVAIYTLGWLWKIWEKRRPQLVGEIVTPDKKSIAKVILSIEQKDGKPLEIVQSNQSGQYQFHTKLAEYQLQVTDVRFKVAHKNRKQALTVIVTKDDHYHPIVMQPVK